MTRLMEGAKILRLVFLFCCVSCAAGVTTEKGKYKNHIRNTIKRLLDCLENDDCILKSGAQKSTNNDQFYNNRINKKQSHRVNSVYLNGVVYTVDGETWDTQAYDALVVNSDGFIDYIGSNANAKEYITQESVVYDLNKAMVLPGFHDVHMHPLEAMSPMGGTCELDIDSMPTDFIQRLKDCAPNQIGTEWVLGKGHSITKMLEHIASGGKSPKLILDEAIPHKPAVMMETTSHSVWANSLALEKAGITALSENVVGGIIMREPGSREPNGILFENQGIEIMDLALAPTTEIMKINAKGLKEAMELIPEYGITSICDARVYWKRGHLEAWKENCENDDITVRAVLGLWAYPDLDNDFQANELKKRYFNSKSGCYNVSQIKLYSDGLLESTTAKLLKKYDINLKLQGLQENKGMNYYHEGKLADLIEKLQNFKDEQGFDFHIHAIEDSGVREALNAIERAQNAGNYQRTPRHRMTHLELIDRADLNRFEELGVTADFQVSGKFTLPEHIPDLSKIIGRKRAYNFIPVRSVFESGAVTTFSSDWDVSGLNPLVGIQHATERRHQSVSVRTAIEMYTINSAYVMRHEDVTGSLKIGKAADLVILAEDILNIDTKAISSTQILGTIFQGDITYQNPASDVLRDVAGEYWDE